jgi:hypothetical protein
MLMAWDGRERLGSTCCRCGTPPQRSDIELQLLSLDPATAMDAAQHHAATPSAKVGRSSKKESFARRRRAESMRECSSGSGAARCSAPGGAATLAAVGAASRLSSLCSFRTRLQPALSCICWGGPAQSTIISHALRHTFVRPRVRLQRDERQRRRTDAPTAPARHPPCLLGRTAWTRSAEPLLSCTVLRSWRSQLSETCHGPLRHAWDPAAAQAMNGISLSLRHRDGARRCAGPFPRLCTSAGPRLQDAFLCA